MTGIIIQSRRNRQSEELHIEGRYYRCLLRRIRYKLTNRKSERMWKSLQVMNQRRQLSDLAAKYKFQFNFQSNKNACFANFSGLPLYALDGVLVRLKIRHTFHPNGWINMSNQADEILKQISNSDLPDSAKRNASGAVRIIDLYVKTSLQIFKELLFFDLNAKEHVLHTMQKTWPEA